jgi:4-alpha-glucanotransferase
VYSYRVLLFEKRADGSFIPPRDYPRRAIATITTHDLPTLLGYWSASDVELRRRLSLYPSDEMRLQVLDERVRDRHALLAALGAEGIPVTDCDGSETSYSAALSRAVHVYLARTQSALVVLQAEDLLGMADPVNVPGTHEDHANWQRKMSCDTHAMFETEAVRTLLGDVHSARTGDLIRVYA